MSYGSSMPLLPSSPTTVDVAAAFLPPPEIVKAIERLGISKANQSIPKMVILAVIAGVYAGFGGMVGISFSRGCPLAEAGAVKFMFGATFTVGLILIVICGGELATGNFGIIFPAFLNKKVSLMKMLKAWTVVYFSNILGCVLAAFFLAYSSDLYAQDPYLKAVIGIAEAKTSGKTFFQMFCLGLGANWLVNLACYMATAGKTITCKIIAMWFPIMTFATIGFEHSVANTFLVPLGMMYGANVSIFSLIVNNLIPVTIGNIVSASCFVALPYWFCYAREEVKL